jgi:hypothetical protein
MIFNRTCRYTTLPFKEADDHHGFHLGVFAIGFEERSGFVARQYWERCERLIGIDLESPEFLSYDENLAWALEKKVERIRKSQLSLSRGNWFPEKSDSEMRILVDVSSMDRKTLSLVIFRLLSDSNASRTSIAFLYAPVKFIKPPRTLVPIEYSGPVNELLGMQPRDPNSPIIMFLGLGYEIGLALGVVETFEPASVLAYIPRGTDKNFDREVYRANLPLFADGKYVSRIEYNISSPANAMIDLKDRFLSAKDRARIVFVPMGPKIFSAMAILCGYIFWPEVCVWRISSRISKENAQRYADGSITGFRLQIDEDQTINDMTTAK